MLTTSLTAAFVITALVYALKRKKVQHYQKPQVKTLRSTYPEKTSYNEAFQHIVNQLNQK